MTRSDWSGERAFSAIAASNGYEQIVQNRQLRQRGVEETEEKDIQQFRAPDQTPEGQDQGQIRRNSEESDLFGHILSSRFRKWKRGGGLRIIGNLSDS